LQTSAADFYKQPSFISTVTRATVLQELRTARATGQLPAAFAEAPELRLLHADRKAARATVIATQSR
jgi:hypothetical protein